MRFSRSVSVAPLLIAASFWAIAAARAAELSGTVIDSDGRKVAGAMVRVPTANARVASSEDGRFSLDVPAGALTMQVSRDGYEPETRSVMVGEGGSTIDLVLKPNALEAPPITVTAKPRPSRVLTAPASVSIIGGRQLERQRGQTLVESVQNAPGVGAATTGAGIAKPVIRGLTGQRVLVLNDGIRQEGQQWGDEHGPEIDPHGMERVEIVRGPQSLLYGPEALSGVVNVIRRPLATEGERFALGGLLATDGFTHNDQLAGSLELRGGGRGYGASIRTGGRKSEDISTPAGRLRNSGTDQTEHGAAVGVMKDWGSITADWARFNQKLEIHEDPVAAPGATAYQRVNHEKTRLRLDLPFNRARLEMATGWQRNMRREFETATDANPALRLVQDSHTADLKLHHEEIGPVQGTLGLYGMLQKNDTQAAEKLIPGYRMHDLGAFLFEELPLGRLTLSAGGRYDARRLFIREEGTLGVTAQTLKYDSVTGALGGAWNFSEGWALAGNLGTGWRAPSPFELFVNGEHEGTGRFEVGRKDLKPERSINTDLSLRRSSQRLQAELSVFRNRINHFVFAAPTGTVDAGSGLPIFNIKQANATLIGGELAVRVQAVEKLLVSGGADFVRGQNEELNQPLPQIPAHRFKWGLRYTEPSLWSARNAYISVGGKVAARQNRVASNEPTTAGYGLVDIGLGTELPFKGGEARLDLGVENAFNQPYRDHLSRWRAFALNAGRSFTLRLSVPFGNI